MQYISARLAPGVTDKVLAETGKKKISKVALRALPLDRWVGAKPVEFISTSMFHRPGSWFTLAELPAPSTVELRDDAQQLVAMITLDNGAVRIS